MESDPSSFEELCSRLLDGSLEDHEREKLLELAAADPANLASIREQLVISGALSSLLSKEQGHAFEESVISHIRAVGDETDGSFPAQVIGRIQHHRIRRQRMILAVAAAIALVGIPLSFLFKRPVSERPPVAVGFNLIGNSTAGHGEIMRIGKTVDLTRGIMRLEFFNGAVVAVESPASFTITSANEILLRSGKLNGWCPESAHGFRVNTRSATLKDLGTSFGVDAASDGSADFLVLDGKVTVTKNGDTRDLVKGSALRATTATGLQPLAFEPSPFTRTWPVASGIQSTRGEVIPAPPNTPEVVAAREDDTHILVIPERRDFQLSPITSVNIVDPGDYVGDNLFHSYPLGTNPGSRGRSYLLRYNPVGIVEPKDFKHFEGSVTFDRPVLGIIAVSAKLTKTDLIASASPLPPAGKNQLIRGLEGGEGRADRVKLSEDRRTVSVYFWAGESVDEIRVITAEK